MDSVQGRVAHLLWEAESQDESWEGVKALLEEAYDVGYDRATSIVRSGPEDELSDDFFDWWYGG